MIRRPPRSTRTDTLFPYTTLFRSPSQSAPATNLFPADGAASAPEGADASRTGKVPAIGALTPNGSPTAALSISSEARRVGPECVSTCRSRWSPSHLQKHTNRTHHRHSRTTQHHTPTHNPQA